MNNITVIIPIHKFNKETDLNYFNAAYDSVFKNSQYFDGTLKLAVVCPETVSKELIELGKENLNIIINNGKTDFCSQINFAVGQIDTEYFSILEFDDTYTDKWFASVQEYSYGNEDVSVFLPINVHYETENGARQYCNEIVWANEFSKELGYIDFDCLENYSGFNLTGGVFNTEDFKKIGGLKSSIQVAFNYEFLLRLTNKKLRCFVVPKEGYVHLLNRTDSLTDEYEKSLTSEMVDKWFEVAKNEYTYTTDRNITLNFKQEVLK